MAMCVPGVAILVGTVFWTDLIVVGTRCPCGDILFNGWESILINLN